MNVDEHEQLMFGSGSCTFGRRHRGQTHTDRCSVKSENRIFLVDFSSVLRIGKNESYKFAFVISDLFAPFVGLCPRCVNCPVTKSKGKDTKD